MIDKFRKLPIFKIIPLESEFTEIAVTFDPAIEEYFLKFNSDEVVMTFSEDKKVITGPVMIPNKLIYRNDALGERFITYDEEGIQKAASLFMKNGLKFNSEHTDKGLPIDITESYFALEGNSFNVPVGSWIVTAKVNDESLWIKLKEKNMGFSFQGLFNNEIIGVEEINFSKEETNMDLKEKLSAAINAVLFGELPVEMAAEPIVPEVPVEKPADEPVKEDKPLTSDEVKQMILDAITVASEEIMKEVEAKIAELSGKTTDLAGKVEEFSKQPLSQPITETVATPKLTSGSDYSYLSQINK